MLYYRFENRGCSMFQWTSATLIGIPPTAWITLMQSLLSELSMFQDLTLCLCKVVQKVKYGTARSVFMSIVIY